MNLNGKNILITGASGLIGRNLVKRITKNFSCNLSVVKHKNTFNSHCAIDGDLLDFNFCKTVTKNIDVVFHCAANSSGAATQILSPTLMSRDNTVMNSNILEACYQNQIKKFIWLASTTGYPEGDHAMVENEMFNGDPFSKYFAVGWMKRYTEKLCELYSTKVPNPISCITLRPSNIYGPFDKIDPKRSHVLSALIRKTIEGMDPIEIWGDGQDVRDLLYVDDMVDAMIASAEQIEGFDQLNIGYGQSFTVLDILNIIQEVSGQKTPYKLIPTGPRMIPVRRVDISKAKMVLNWVPKTELKTGIQKTYQWMTDELNRENEGNKHD